MKKIRSLFGLYFGNPDKTTTNEEGEEKASETVENYDFHEFQLIVNSREDPIIFPT